MRSKTKWRVKKENETKEGEINKDTERQMAKTKKKKNKKKNWEKGQEGGKSWEIKER